MPKFYKHPQMPPGRFQHGIAWCGRYLMLGAFLLLTNLFLMSNQLSAQRIWINEINHSPSAGEQKEMEIVVEDGTDLSQVTVSFYDVNGNSQGSLNVANDFTAGDVENRFSVYSVQSALIPDLGGMAIAYRGVVVQFLDYNFAIFAIDGPASGYLSTHIGVGDNDAVNMSIGLEGTGTNYSDFSWVLGTRSVGSANSGQNFAHPEISASMTDTPSATEPLGAGDEVQYDITIENTGAGGAKNTNIDRLAPVDPNLVLVPGSFQSTPLAHDIYIHHVQEDIPIEITLMGLDLDGDSFTYAITDGTSNGSLSAISPAGATAGNATITYTPNTNFFGTDQFTYSVTDDDGGIGPATVYLVVQPVNDPPMITCGEDQVIDNDQGLQTLDFGLSFSLGADNESYQQGSIFTTNNNNSIFANQPQVSGGGTLTYGPAPGQSGTATVTVTVSDGILSESCTFDITVNAAGEAPVAQDDAFILAQCGENLSGNIFADNGNGADNLGIPSATVSHFGGGSLGGNVTDNAAGASAAFAGGTLSIAADGAISLINITNVGTFTVDYRLANSTGTSDGTVTITITQKVFVVDNTVGAGGNGSLATPFQTLAEAAAAANSSGDIIYVRTGSGSYDGGITLDAGQLLLGEGVPLECPTGNLVIPAGPRPTITNSGGIGITLANENTIRGLNVSATSSDGISGSSIVGLVIDQVNITDAGAQGIGLDNISGTVDIDNIQATHSADRNLQIANSSGSVSVSLDASSFSNAQGTRGVEMLFSGSSMATIDMNQCTITDNATGNTIQTELDIHTFDNAQVTQCDITNSVIETDILGGGAGFSQGINLLADNNSTLNFNVIGNTSIVAEGGHGVFAKADNNAMMQGRINNNTGIRMPGSFSSGIQVQSDAGASMIVEVNNNSIEYDGFAAGAITADTEGAGSATMYATINGNTIFPAAAPATPFVFGGVELLSRNNHILCANVNNNTVTGVLTGQLSHEFVVSESSGGMVHIQGFTTNAATTWTANGNTQANSINETGAASAPPSACLTPTHAMP